MSASLLPLQWAAATRGRRYAIRHPCRSERYLATLCAINTHNIIRTHTRAAHVAFPRNWLLLGIHKDLVHHFDGVSNGLCLTLEVEILLIDHYECPRQMMDRAELDAIGDVLHRRSWSRVWLWCRSISGPPPSVVGRWSGRGINLDRSTGHGYKWRWCWAMYGGGRAGRLTCWALRGWRGGRSQRRKCAGHACGDGGRSAGRPGRR